MKSINLHVTHFYTVDNSVAMAADQGAETVRRQGRTYRDVHKAVLLPDMQNTIGSKTVCSKGEPTSGHPSGPPLPDEVVWERFGGG